MTKPINRIIHELSQPFPQFEKTKDRGERGGGAQRFIPWTGCRQILDQCAPGWHSEVKEVTEVAGRLVAIVRIYVSADEGLVYREGAAQKLLPPAIEEKKMYGDPTKNVVSDAFKRAAYMFGIGEYLRGKNQAFTPEQARQEQTKAKTATAERKPDSQQASEHQAALKLQAPTRKQQLVKAIDAQFKALNWKDGRHRKFLLEELSVNGEEWQHTTWYAELLMACSEGQLEALLVKLKDYEAPTEGSIPINAGAFWEEARGITVGGHRAFDDATIKFFIKRHTDESSKTNWASALAALKTEAAQMASGKVRAA